jgi:hypothetical protein
MSKFTSVNPVENSTLAEAKNLVKQRQSYRLACNGIFVNPNGSVSQEDYIPEADFIGDKFAPVRWVIRRTVVEDGHGDYVNVGMALDRLKRASSLQAGVISMIEEDLTKSNVPFQPGEGAARMTSTEMVSKAIESALKKEWALSAPPPTVDPGPL